MTVFYNSIVIIVVIVYVLSGNVLILSIFILKPASAILYVVLTGSKFPGWA